MHYVTNAKYLKDYKIEVTYNDRKSGVIDLEKIICNDKREIFQELRNLAKFKQIKVDADTVTWSNGLDLAPEFLYEKLKN